VQELTSAAAAIEAQAGVRARLAAAAGTAWQGPHRPVFDDEHRRLVAQAAALADACRRAAAQAVAADSRVLTRAGRFS